MNCPACREGMVDLLYGELSPEVAARVRAHLVDCPACTRELALLERTQATLAAWREVPLPARLEVSREVLAAGISCSRWSPWRWLAAPWAPVPLGAAMAGSSFLLLHGYVLANPLPPMAHLVLGILSASLFALLFRLALPGQVILRGVRVHGLLGIGARQAARCALVCAALGCVLIAVAPLPVLCRLLGLAPDSSLTYAVLLLCYSALAATGAALTVPLASGVRLAHLLALATLYVLAMAPGLVIISVPFTAPIYLAAVAGAALGVTLGGPAGLTLRRFVTA